MWIELHIEDKIMHDDEEPEGHYFAPILINSDNILSVGYDSGGNTRIVTKDVIHIDGVGTDYNNDYIQDAVGEELACGNYPFYMKELQVCEYRTKETFDEIKQLIGAKGVKDVD